jgi:hypothetical protein
MLKNITLSADELLIRNARKKAKSEHTTLNSQFRDWLKKYTSMGTNANDYKILMEKLSYTTPTHKFTREEMNER